MTTAPRPQPGHNGALFPEPGPRPYSRKNTRLAFSWRPPFHPRHAWLGGNRGPTSLGEAGHAAPSQVVSWGSRAGATIAVTLISRALETETAHS